MNGSSSLPFFTLSEKIYEDHEKGKREKIIFHPFKVR